MTDRERLTYTGDHDLFLPGSVGPRPDYLTPGDAVEVNRDAADLLIARGDFDLIVLAAGEVHEEVQLAIEEPIPLDRLLALEAEAPTQGVTDEAGHEPAPSAAEVLASLDHDGLDDALSDAGLPAYGDDETKRARLQAFYSEKAHQVGTDTTSFSISAIAEYAEQQGVAFPTTNKER